VEQAADYWCALAERVEQQEEEQPGRTALVLHLPVSAEAHTDSMPVFKYFVTVGIALGAVA
jgi:hypothetical protein